MDVSLIICTRDRSRQLGACLESVRRLTFEQPWELILVDNGSVDDTANVIKEFIGTASVPATYLFEPNRGKSRALNRAIFAARGEILAFTDDDCYPAEEFLTQLRGAFADPSVGYITGRIMLHDPSDYPLTINESLLPRTFLGDSLIRVGDVQGANMAFRRQVLLDIGGFDPLFGPGSLFIAEELDVAARASAIGWLGQYRPDVVVRHHHGRKRSEAISLMRSYAVGLGAYHMKLLLSERRFWLFARSVYEFWRARIWWQPEGPVWETVGAAKYAYLYFSRTLRTRFTRQHASRPPSPRA
jgi:glycosyltransferase involved in cell wall biosynthesis